MQINMKIVTRLSPTFLAFALLTVAPAAQEPQAWRQLANLGRAEQVAVYTWFDRDCGASELRTLEDQLVAAAAAIEPVFWEAVELGPPPATIATWRKTLAARYAERIRWLRRFGAEQMGAEETQRQLAVTEASFIDREVARSVKGWRSKALAGLGVIGTRATIPRLQPLAADPANPLRSSAAAAIAAIQAR